MAYSQKLKGLFPEISLNWEDLLLLETFQIKYLPEHLHEYRDAWKQGCYLGDLSDEACDG